MPLTGPISRDETPFDYPMPELKAENIDDDGIIKLYAAVIERAKLDYVESRKRILKGFADSSARKRKTKRTYAENRCREVLYFFEYIGIKKDRRDKLINQLESEAEAWWSQYKKHAQEKAAKEWTDWGMCLDDDIY